MEADDKCRIFSDEMQLNRGKIPAHCRFASDALPFVQPGKKNDKLSADGFSTALYKLFIES